MVIMIPRFSFIVFSSFLICSPLFAVDKSNFKTCEQSGFCKRHRAIPPNESPYVAHIDNAVVTRYGFYVPLENKVSNIVLNLTVTGLEGPAFRVRIDEFMPLRPRYEPEDVLVRDPIKRRTEFEKNSPTLATLTMNRYKVILYGDPFSLSILEANEAVMTINSRGLFKFEHSRVRGASRTVSESETSSGGAVQWLKDKIYGSEKEGDEGSEVGEGSEVEEEEVGTPEVVDEVNETPTDTVEEPDQWEETFKSHTDSKPNGPTSVGLDVNFMGFRNVYGIPEHADSLSLRTTTGGDPYRLYNLDVFEYEVNNPMALYGSIPFMIGHSVRHSLGLFWLNAAETWVDIERSEDSASILSRVASAVTGSTPGGAGVPSVATHWFSESGIIDMFVLLGPQPRQVFRQYAVLTGTAPVPPLFAIAYHQCRWNYIDQTDVAEVNENFDVHDIPCDVIWLDIDHTDGRRYLTWDSRKFPEPEAMIANVSRCGRRMVTLVDPHIKKDSGYKVYQESSAQNGFLVRNKDGTPYENWCWPGTSIWLDYINPAVRQWWASLFSTNYYKGSTLDLFTWNDMNEPSVFNGPEVTMHKDAVHHGGWEHRDVHNLYGMAMQRATAEGLVQRSGGKLRPFVLSRAFYAGSQRYGAVWTGDNSATWEHLALTGPMLLAIGVAGVPLAGADVGGFFGNPEEELLVRWYQAAAYQPFFRAHAHHDTRRREPWTLREAANRERVRAAIRARYALLPYWYTTFYRNHASGDLVMRPLWAEFPDDSKTFDMDRAWMVGPALLVQPVVAKGVTQVSVYLPGVHKTIWYDAANWISYTSPTTVVYPVTMDTVPLFIKGGTIVPSRERVRRSSALGLEDPFTLLVALNAAGFAVGEVYMDDGRTTANVVDDRYSLRSLRFGAGALRCVSGDGGRGVGEFGAPVERVVILGVGAAPRGVNVSLLGADGAAKPSSSQLEFEYLGGTKAVIVRKPWVSIGADWELRLVS